MLTPDPPPLSGTIKSIDTRFDPDGSGKASNFAWVLFDRPVKIGEKVIVQGEDI